MVGIIRKIYFKYNLSFFRKSPLLWLKAAYLTLRFIDEYKKFPAIYFNTPMKIKIKKGRNSKFIVNDYIIFEKWLGNQQQTFFLLGDNSRLIVENEFGFGAGINVLVSNNATFLIKGKEIESASGITGNSEILVQKYLEFGKDILVAWNTFFTDCDWHTIENKKNVIPTIIGDHVWVGVGARILKGANIGSNSIVATNSVVVSGSYPNQVMLSGIPAKVVSENINNWHRDFVLQE